MKQINKKALYESIMNDVAKVVKNALNESDNQWYVIDDGEIYNVFSSDDFDEEGYYIGSGEIDLDFNINDSDIVKTFDSMDDAFEYAENFNDNYSDDDDEIDDDEIDDDFVIY